MCTLFGILRWLSCFLLVLAWFMQPALLSADSPLVTEEIRYHQPKADEVFLVWGGKGWETMSEELRPAGTFLKREVMHTPMSREGDMFVAKVRVPSGTILNYGFLSLKKGDSGTSQPTWDGDYRFTCGQDGVIEVQAGRTQGQAMEWPSVSDILDSGPYILVATGMVVGIWIMLKRDPGLSWRGPVIHRRDARQDCLFLGTVVLGSVVLYVGKLGFYSDDWSTLADFAMSADQSLIGFLRTVLLRRYGDFPDVGNIGMRPAAVLYLAVLCWLFGLEPLGYPW